jgi:phosphoglucosamine mutase
MGKYFGTDGIRGIAGEKLTSGLAYKIGRFLGQYPDGKVNKILIGQDTRVSSPMLACSLIAGITSSGSHVQNLGVTTTPSLSYLIENNDSDFAIMISASHNPYFDNGIKIFNRHGEKLEASIEHEIEQFLDGEKDQLPNKTGKEIGHVYDDAKYIRRYLDFLKSQAIGDLSSFKVLVDAANGASYQLVQQLFTELNIKADYLNVEPTGININDLCGATHVQHLAEAMRGKGYDLGLSFDGDADRLMAVDETGRIVDGDAIIYLSALQLKKENKLTNNSVVLTVMSNFGLRQALASNDIEVIEVDVGDKYVQAALKQHKYVLGGEQSGHIIYFDDLNTGDGLLTAIKLFNILAMYGQPLSSLLVNLPVYPQVTKSLNVTHKEEVMNHPQLISLISRIKLELTGHGKLLVRPSGTEPSIRITIQADTDELCHNYVQQISDFISENFVN